MRLILNYISQKAVGRSDRSVWERCQFGQWDSAGLRYTVEAMKRLSLFWLSLVLIAGIMPLHAVEKRPSIKVLRPTIVAFFPPVTEKDLSKSRDTNETLADFQFYAGKVRAPLKQRGFDFREVYAHGFEIRLDKSKTIFKPVNVDVGYYIVAPGSEPRVLYGVMTDSDLLRAADEYTKTIVWKNGAQEKMCWLGTYHDAIDLGFNNAARGLGEILVSVKTLPSFQKEYAFVFTRVGEDVKLYRVAFQSPMWTQLGIGSPRVPRKTRQECLEIAASAKIDLLAVDSHAQEVQELWTAFGNIDLTVDTCPRSGKRCAFYVDGTDYILQTQDGRVFRITETKNQKGVTTESPALLAWIHRVQQFVATINRDK
jgi:hypothetical protein